MMKQEATIGQVQSNKLPRSGTSRRCSIPKAPLREIILRILGHEAWEPHRFRPGTNFLRMACQAAKHSSMTSPPPLACFACFVPLLITLVLPAFADVTNALRETMITAAKIIYMNLRAKISQAKSLQTNHVFPALSVWTGVSLNGNPSLVFARQGRIPFPKINCQPDSDNGRS